MLIKVTANPPAAQSATCHWLGVWCSYLWTGKDCKDCLRGEYLKPVAFRRKDNSQCVRLPLNPLELYCIWGVIGISIQDVHSLFYTKRLWISVLLWYFLCSQWLYLHERIFIWNTVFSINKHLWFYINVPTTVWGARYRYRGTHCPYLLPMCWGAISILCTPDYTCGTCLPWLK